MESIIIILIIVVIILGWLTWHFKQRLAPIVIELNDVKAKYAESSEQVQTLSDQIGMKNEEIQSLTMQLSELEGLLKEAAEKLAGYEELENLGKGDGLLEKTAQKLIALGVPGLVLLVMISLSGWVGAAAITSTLAALGGPAGMIGGVAVLIAMGLASDALAKYGLPKIAESVIRGLIKKGQSIISIREQVRKYPSIVISNKLKDRLMKLLDDYESGSLV